MPAEKKPAIVLAIDGTVSDNSNRLHYLKGEFPDWVRYHAEFLKDKPIQATKTLLNALIWYRHMKVPDLEIVLNTDRPSYMRNLTEEWMQEHVGIHNCKIYTRNHNSAKMSPLETKEYNLKRIKREFNVLMAFDNDPEAADMYAANGVTCLQPKLQEDAYAATSGS